MVNICHLLKNSTWRRGPGPWLPTPWTKLEEILLTWLCLKTRFVAELLAKKVIVLTSLET